MFPIKNNGLWQIHRQNMSVRNSLHAGSSMQKELTLRKRGQNVFEKVFCSLLCWCCLAMSGAGQGIEPPAATESTPLTALLHRLDLQALYLEYRLNRIDQEAQPVRRQRELLALLHEFETAGLVYSAEKMPINWRRLKLLAHELNVMPTTSLRLAWSASEIRENFLDLLQVWQIGQQADGDSTRRADLNRLLAELLLIEKLLEDERRSQVLSPSSVAQGERLNIAIGHATFLTGWLHLARELMGSDTPADDLRIASERFARLLDTLPGQGKSAVNEDLRDLTGLETNALIGQAVTLQRQGKTRDADALFTRLAKRSADGALQSEFWKLRCLTFKRTRNIDQHARQMFFNHPLPQYKKPLIVEVLACASALWEIGERDLAASLAKIGMAKALTSRESKLWSRVPQELLERIKQDAFFRDWLRLAEICQDSGNRNTADGKSQALSPSELNLTFDQRSIYDPQDVAAALFLRAELLRVWQYLQQSLEVARQAQAIRREHLLLPDEDLEWFIVSGTLDIARRDANEIAAAVAIGDDFLARFPSSIYLQSLRVELEQLELSRLTPEDSFQVLTKKTSEATGNWRWGLLLVEECFRGWQAARTLDRESRSVWLARFDNALQQFLDRSGTPDLPRLRAATLAQRIDLESQRRDRWSEGEKRILYLVSRVPSDSPAIDDALATVISSAMQRNDRQTAFQIAHQLLACHPRPELEEVARVAIAKVLEDRLLDTPKESDEFQKCADQLLDNYQRLLARFDEQQIKQRVNLQVALLRVTLLFKERNRIVDARPFAEMLVRVSPDNKSAVKTAADVLLANHEHRSALELYRRLSSGAAVGSDDWLEAKLGAVRCLAVLNPESAKDVYEQVLDLVPQLNSTWRSAFESIGF